jgi:hypothetical protein
LHGPTTTPSSWGATAPVRDPAARVDSTGLQYTVRQGRLYVSYPHRNAGHGAYGTGFAVGCIPTTYWTNAPNDITRERAALWTDLLCRGGIADHQCPQAVPMASNA